MLKKMFSVYDRVAKVWSDPFYSLSVGIAQRDFMNVSLDPNTSIGRNPNDFELWEVGIFNDDDCDIVKHVSAEKICRASDFCKEE